MAVFSAMLRALLMAAMLTLFVGQAEAGSRDDPEVVDDANDVTRYPGVPTVDPSVDLLGIWFIEAGDDLVVNLHVSQIGSTGPEVPNVNGGESYAVNVFVDGENDGDERCSGLGDFGVSWHLGQAEANLRQGWRYDGQACPADDEPIAVSVADNVITWTVPKASLAMLVSGSVLTVARAQAWSGDTWPMTPGDDADQAPGRGFVVQSAAAATQDAAPATDAGAEEAGGETSSGPEDDGGEPTADAPGAPAVILAVALALAAMGRRRA